MKILVTGANGYLGNCLAKRLSSQEDEINLLVRDLNSKNLPVGKKIKLFKGDITDAASIEASIKGCTQVYHCAAFARYNSKDRNLIYETNVDGTKNILQAASAFNIEKLVFTSSAGVFGPSLNIPLTENDPRIESFESDYDFSKHMAENLVREFVSNGINAVIVNPTRIYGPGPETHSNAVTRLIKHILFKKILLLPKIEAYRTNYCFIDDVVNGHLFAMLKGRAGESYILGGENISYKELLSSITAYASSKNYTLKLPVKFLKRLAYISELLNIGTELTPAMITRFAKNRMVSSEKAINNLGYCITPFNEGIKSTIDYVKNNR